ncbi:transcriptional regulator [Methanoregula sp. PtaB.Bin085]|uniref:ArsR/SmtB family transcription factor n=2 Tax=unclassified Methanoregula TaxID=2649730 RepID=UPI0009C70758|nr:helix-turn-helix domain-containing protein [Methanoregula sp. PtaB.Bin085]OPX63787.1 MAG: Helix-turn-helix domain protein [Methanoregula sp. PtaB.Bin085]
MTENVVFLEPGDERAQKIAKAMGSQTASDILQILGEGPKSLTDITERLNIPMNTAKYHVENLLDAGLIAVEQTKYSIKGREVKIYTLTNQLLVVAPRQTNVRSLLLKYASLFGIVALATVIISVLPTLFGAGSMIRGSANTLNMAPEYTMVRETDTGVGAAKAISEAVAQNVTRAPEVLSAGTKGAADTWAAGNISPSILHTAAATVPPTPAPTALPTFTPTMMPPQPVTQAAFDGGLGTGAGTVFPVPDPALAFFLGGVLVIFILLCYEAWLWKKSRK